MTGVAQWNVYGPVETLQTEFAEWDLLKEEWQTPRHSSLARFHRDGRIDEREHHNPNGSVSRTSYIYDESGRMIETTSRLDDGPIHKTLYLYDEAGRPLRTVHVDENGIQHDFEICSYDESGRKSKLHIAPKLEPHVGYYFSLEGTETSFGATGATTMTTLYDGHGNWTKRVVSVRLEENPDFQRSNIEGRKITYYRE